MMKIRLYSKRKQSSPGPGASRLPLLLRGLGLVILSSLLPGCAAPGPDGGEGPARVPSSPRIVAIGDLHGDLEASRAALRLAGAIDLDDRWAGGDLIVVQTGDILDRGDDEREIWALFDRLGEEARKKGGAVYTLNGNHELMNAYQDFRYVTEGGFEDFRNTPPPSNPDSAFLALDPEEQGRAAAFLPGGPAALRLSKQRVALVLDRTLFVHGGVLPANLTLGLDSLNVQVQQWLRGERPEPEWVRGDDSPVWARLYSRTPDTTACDVLSEVLDSLDVDRMVVGHTVQQTGVTGFCGGRVWAIDVGMASAYGGRPEVLEIRQGRVRSIRKR